MSVASMCILHVCSVYVRVYVCVDVSIYMYIVEGMSQVSSSYVFKTNIKFLKNNTRSLRFLSISLQMVFISGQELFSTIIHLKCNSYQS